MSDCNGKCGDKCNSDTCKCDIEDGNLFKEIEDIFSQNNFKNKIVVVSFADFYSRSVIGRIYSSINNILVLYKVFELVPDEEQGTLSHLTGFARGSVSKAISIPMPFICGIPNDDVKDAYMNGCKEFDKIMDEYKNGKKTSNLFVLNNGKTLQ
jgi:hypothetical protein